MAVEWCLAQLTGLASQSGFKKSRKHFSVVFRRPMRDIICYKKEVQRLLFNVNNVNNSNLVVNRHGKCIK